jgi:hypothetical protein
MTAGQVLGLVGGLLILVGAGLTISEIRLARTVSYTGLVLGMIGAVLVCFGMFAFPN